MNKLRSLSSARCLPQELKKDRRLLTQTMSILKSCEQQLDQVKVDIQRTLFCNVRIPEVLFRVPKLFTAVRSYLSFCLPISVRQMRLYRRQETCRRHWEQVPPVNSANSLDELNTWHLALIGRALKSWRAHTFEQNSFPFGDYFGYAFNLTWRKVSAFFLRCAKAFRCWSLQLA